MVLVGEQLDIPEAELEFTTSRSSGPGGQNVNKVSTRVTLLLERGRLTEHHGRAARSAARETGGSHQPGGRAAGDVTEASDPTREPRGSDRVRLAGWSAEALTEAPPRMTVRVPASADQQAAARQKRQRERLKRQRSDEIDLDD